jgi:hypothetical protein
MASEQIATLMLTLPEAAAQSILRHWQFAELRISLAGAPDYVGRVWEIELGPLVDDEHLGLAQTVSIGCRDIELGEAI